MSENTLTLRGGPRDGAVIGAPSCATIVSLEFVSDRAAPFTALDSYRPPEPPIPDAAHIGRTQPGQPHPKESAK